MLHRASGCLCKHSNGPFGFHKMRGTSWLAEWLIASQERLFSMDSWSYLCDVVSVMGLVSQNQIYVWNKQTSKSTRHDRKQRNHSENTRSPWNMPATVHSFSYLAPRISGWTRWRLFLILMSILLTSLILSDRPGASQEDGVKKAMNSTAQNIPITFSFRSG